MRLFLITWAGKKFGHINVILELKKRGHDIVYWVGQNLDKEVDKSQFLKTIFHDNPDALRASPAKGINGSKFMPPSQEILEKLSGAESTVLTMMNKLFENIPVSERKHLYYNYVQYWLGVMQEFKPDAIIFPVAPHTAYSFVIYSLAKLLNIKTIFFMLTRVSDRVLIMNDFTEGSVDLKKEMDKNKDKQFVLDDLSQDIKEYYNTQKDSLAKPTPKDIIEYNDYYSGFRALRVKAHSFWTTLTVLKDFSVFIKILTYFPRKFISNQRTEYELFAAEADFNKKFVYVALNQQPENTTSPLGGVFVDQILMVETLSASLPEDWLIYVKEHPLQWKPRGLDYFSYRYRGYYKSMADLPNVRIMPINTDSFALIDKSQCVATVNGTAGWEAVLRGKPSLVFGYAWYRDCPGVFRLNDAASCRAAFEKIASGSVQISQQDIINYLFSFNKVSIRALTDDYLLSTATVGAEESAQNYTRSLLKELTN